jgi:hypothetical protein
MAVDEITKFVEENGGESAKSSLAAYFYKEAFTGSSYEKFFDIRKHPDEFTAQDLVAVSMLSVTIPPRVAKWVLDEGKTELSELLKKIDPTDLSIKSEDVDLSKNSSPYKLWKSIRDRRDMGETKTSKLIATKRPNLFPIFDRHVARALKITEKDYWLPWQKFLRSENGERCIEKARGFAAELPIVGVSDLRLLDVIIWMRVHGHTFITKDRVNAGSMKAVSYSAPK